MFDAFEQYGGRFNWNSQLWAIAYPAGTIRRITQDGASYGSVAATAGGRSLVAVRDEVRASLWVAPEGDTARARPITSTSNGREGATGIDWTPDGRIVYSATTHESWDIWIANGDGSQPKQLTNDPGVENQPRVLPDGTGIIFTSRASGGSARYRSGPSISTAATLARSPPVAACSADMCRPSATTSTSRSSKECGRSPTVCPLQAVRASRCLPIRHGSATIRPDRVSADQRWAVGTYDEPGAPGNAVVAIDGVGPVRSFPFAYTPGVGFGPTWGLADRRLRTWYSATGRRTSGGFRSRLRAQARDDLHLRADLRITGGHATEGLWRCHAEHTRRTWC